jgi:DNA (cytosine-5)-methyltransferase 1
MDALGKAYYSGGGKMGFFRRLSYDEPSPTIVTAPSQKATMLCHPNKLRPLSTKEYGRIQQFPDDWFFMGSIAQIYKQIGNAVPIGLGRAIGQMLSSVAEDKHTIFSRRYKGTYSNDMSWKKGVAIC